MGDFMDNIALGILLPFFGTVFGSLIVLIFKGNPNNILRTIIQGFTAGVMLAASIFSLLIPALNYNTNKNISFISVILGLVIGIMGFLIIDSILLKRRINSLNLAVTIHNIPEGFSVGVIYALALANPIMIREAFLLSLGITIQNIPEGSIVSLNMIDRNNKGRAILSGILSGIVEPICSVIAIILLSYISPLMSFFLSLAGGVMIYVVIDDLIPASNGRLGIIGFTIGFIIMMSLDVLLG